MKIGIVSLGLIGGSILKKFALGAHELYAVTRSSETIDAAKAYTPHVSDDMNILKDCSAVFVCSPINNTLEMLDKLENYVSNDCLVMDTASVKKFISEKKRPYRFIPSHPMAGTENSGFNAALPNLFEGAVWVITPFDDTPAEDIKKAEDLINQLGARMLKTNAEEHDKAAAMISHFPVLLAQALFYSIRNNETAKEMAASGFRDMTRLAAGSVQLGLDMKKYNAAGFKAAEKEFLKSLEFLKNTDNFQIFSKIKDERMKMYSKEGKNILNQAITS